MNWKLNGGILVFAWSVSGTPAGEVVAAWTFNRLTETNAPPAAVGTGTASLVGGVNGAFASGSGSSDPEPAATDSAWNLSGFPARSDVGAIAGALFAVGTQGFRDVQVRCDLRPSNTASRRGRFQYSIDGTSFVDGPVFLLEAGGAFTNGLALDLAGVPLVDDNPLFAFRVVAVPDDAYEFAAVDGRYSPSGTWRLDGVTVSGTPLVPVEPGPSVAPVVQVTNLLSRLTRPGDAPTNAYPDLAVGPGERLEIRVGFADPGGFPYRIDLPVVGGLPPGGGWVGGPGGGPLEGGTTARFLFEPGAADAGRTFEVLAWAWNGAGTNRVAWRIHVPTAAEQGIVLTEFLANPSGDAGSPAFNPLRRDPPAERPGQQDEYLEVVNFHPEAVDLQGWSIRDATGWRHRFPGATVLGPSNVLVLHGGPAGGPAPGLDVPTAPAGSGIVGLSLNNDGDAIAFYNAETNLVFRVVYTAAMIDAAVGGSLSRAPDRDGDFVAQAGVSALAVTPGRRVDGTRFDEAVAGGPGPEGLRVSLVRGASGVLELRWAAEASVEYGVRIKDLEAGGGGAWTEAAAGLVFPEGQGRFPVTVEPGRAGRLFRVGWR